MLTSAISVVRLLLALCALSLLAGCVGPDSSLRVLHPGTWFSGREVKRVEKTAAKVELAQAENIRVARSEVAKASQALAAADTTARPVQLSQRFVDNALPLLDQVAGPMTAKEAAELRELVAGLLAGKVSAEAKQAAAERSVTEISAHLESVQTALDEAEIKLRDGFRRENQLADQYRAEKALRWILIGVLIISAGGLTYLRIQFAVLGGGVASALADVARKAGASDFTTALDVNISPSQQRFIRKLRLAALEQTNA